MKKFISLDFNLKIPSKYQQLKCKLTQFPCKELDFLINEEIFDDEITIFQSFEIKKLHEQLIKLQIVCNALRQLNVKKLSYFAAFLPYTRQNQFTAKENILVNIANNCQIDEIITYDLHNIKIKQFVNGKIENLSMIPNCIQHIKTNFNEKNLVIVFPDAGAKKRFCHFFTNEKFEITTIKKTRIKNDIMMQLFHNVFGKIAIIIDDMIDSGRTAIEAAKVLTENGATMVNVYATHAIFSKNAAKKLEGSNISKIYVSNSLKIKQSKKIEIIAIDLEI
jgi:ribose-phosphate pyrophosphokinase